MADKIGKICDVIMYEGDNSTFIWKHPDEDFNTLTQLIVHESQEAVFFMNGQALDLFGPGRYTLETQNIPKLGGLLKRATGDQTPFHCEVYFINKTVQMGLKWGTDSWIRFMEPEYGVPLEIGASGEMNMMVSDSRKLLTKLVGTMNGIAWAESGANFTKSIQNSFRAPIVTAVKGNLASAIKASDISILEVDEHLPELSAVLRDKIAAEFDEYGLAIPQLYITTIVIPQGKDPYNPDREINPYYKEIKELHAIGIRKARSRAEAEAIEADRARILAQENTEAAKKIVRAQADAEVTRQAGFAEAAVMQAQGITKKDYVNAEVQKAYAEGMGQMGANGGGGGGSTMGDVLGLGIGLKAAQMFANQPGGLFDSLGGNPAQPAQPYAPQGQPVAPAQPYAPQGQPVAPAQPAAPAAEQPAAPAAAQPSSMDAFKTKLEKLALMKEAGLLTDAEIADIKAKLLAEII
ncbi:MAG: SPFH domain-containing protein [Clostridia bacterium]|nr:SPFH domain-containing protein [Clostridia bacterium]MBQ3867131.1 SPFH domain-containing protein [Clostridia bacterium]